jgi:XRE family aerobic/anaerobic benzoate catabolism transcriptional regulator
MNDSRNQSQFESSVVTPSDVDDLLGRLGQNVRSIRTARRMPRRVLSDLSGVSPRYLAQLESGQGNISIGLLHRVAEALGTSLIDLLGQETHAEEQRLLDLFRTADAHTRAGVLNRLEQAAPGPERARRICLIGLRGAGKSTLGRAAGESLGVPFVELNKDIELKAGMPVGEIMALYGADGYRQLEAEAVRRVAARHDRLILAVAGGIVSEPETYATLLSRYHTIWLKASPDEHMHRVWAQGDLRPMNGQPEAMTQLRSLLEARQQDYDRAEAALDTSGKTAEQSLADLLTLIRSRGFLDT